MKIYTRTGDQGTTALFGGERVTKNHPRIEAYGTVDETNAFLGLVRSHLQAGFEILDPMLGRIQEELFVVGADLATPLDARPFVPRVTPLHIEALEHDIDRLEAALPALQHFILPSGSPAGAALHIARTVCRRAERLIVETANQEPLNEHTLVYLNRLSDFFFVASRWVNLQAGVEEKKWMP